MILTEKLKALRKSKGWTQAQAADAIAIQQSYLSKLENGLFEPSEEVIAKIALAYKISTRELSDEQHTNKIDNRFDVFNQPLLTAFPAIFLLIISYLALLFPDTYYTYQLNNSRSTVIHYHVTDQYYGERYSVNDHDNNQYYQLIGQRQITRKENQWLTAIGLILLFISIAQLVRLIKHHQLSQIANK